MYKTTYERYIMTYPIILIITLLQFIIMLPLSFYLLSFNPTLFFITFMTSSFILLMGLYYPLISIAIDKSK